MKIRNIFYGFYLRGAICAFTGMDFSNWQWYVILIPTAILVEFGRVN